jgi:hypothetical protein
MMRLLCDNGKLLCPNRQHHQYQTVEHQSHFLHRHLHRQCLLFLQSGWQLSQTQHRHHQHHQHQQ